MGAQGLERVEPRFARGGSGTRKGALVDEVVRQVSKQEPVRIPREVLEELESVRRYTRAEVLDIPTVRHVAMERGKPAVVVWIDMHEQEYAQGLLNGFLAED
jgi:ethanolamine utilization protein EutQ (cupin superfamily)